MNQIEIEKSGEPSFWEMSYQEDHPDCKHPLPGDWQFGGATDQDPRADPRWVPTVYVYMDQMLRKRYITTEPFCIHVAITSFKEKVEERTGLKIFYVTASTNDEAAGIVYSDTEGALSGV